MKFAHIADVHLGSWSNHPELREFPLLAFERALDTCIEEGVDFILISGDLYDTSIPPIDILSRSVAKMKACKDSDIRIYIIAGSHDFSPTGKTMISVLESAGLVINAARFQHGFVVDRTGAKITGMFGKAAGLERVNYESMRDAANEDGFKIFMMHSAIEEFRPPILKNMEALPLSLLPKGFNYYANGHVHERLVKELDGSYMVFPGELFPTEFRELEHYDCGFVIVNADGKEVNILHKPIKLCDVEMIELDAEGMPSQNVESNIMKQVESLELNKKILLVKASGTLGNGKPSDINFKSIAAAAQAKGAFTVKKNFSGLDAKEFKEVEVSVGTMEDLERDIITKHLQTSSPFANELNIIFDLMSVLKEEKVEGETDTVFKERIKSAAKTVVGLDK
ncbi:MAG: DNA repair exonuclease [Candidatus Aenigmatarchaeota archaeon]